MFWIISGIVVGYILTVVIAYLLFKKTWMNDFCEWTVSDRKIHIIFSLIPFGGIAASIIIWLCSREGNNTPANW